MKPPPRGVVPKGRLPVGVAKAPPTYVVKPPLVGKPPKPRRLRLVRVVDAGDMNDLFAIFPDLPRPPRPPVRVSLRTKQLRRWGAFRV